MIDATKKTEDFYGDYINEVSNPVKNKKMFKRIIGEYCRLMARDFLLRGFVKLPAMLGVVDLYKFKDSKKKSWEHTEKMKPTWIRGSSKNGHSILFSKQLYRKMYKDYNRLIYKAKEKK